jgi:hypothetical protein
VEWLQLLARALIWAAGLVLLLTVIGAIQIATSESELGIAPEFEEQSRGIVAVGALGAGLTGAGILAGLGAILRVLLAERAEPPAERRGPKGPGA